MAADDKQTVEINLEELAKEFGLTDKQQAFADFYIFVTGCDAVSAVELTGYRVEGNGTYDDYTPESKEYYINLQRKRYGRELLANPKILGYITKVRESLHKQLIVDKLWVMQKLKGLADKGSESTQIKALDMIGKELGMYGTERTMPSSDNDAVRLAREAFEQRKIKNVVVLDKEGTNAD